MKHLIQALARRLLASLALLLSLGAASLAHAENVFYIDNQTSGVTGATGIYSVDITTGGPATRLVALTGNQYNATLATRPTDGMLFWLDADTSPPNLWRWDPSNPANPPVLLGSPGGIQGVVRLGFDAAGRLLAMDRPSSSLWILSTSNGSILGTIPLSGVIPTSGGGDLCLDPNNNTLYLTVNTELYTVSPFGEIVLLGTVSNLLPAGGPFDVITGCAVTVGGTLIISQNNQSRLSVVNPLTVAATQLPQVTSTSLIGDLSSAPTGLQADINVAKVAQNPTPGGSATFVVTVTNNGPSKATDVRISDPTPAGLTYVSGTASQGSYSPVQTTVGVNTYPAGTWRIGTLTPGQSVTLTLNYTVTGTTTISNTASVSYNDMYDPVSSNNSATATITPSVDLQIAKAAASTVGIGASASYTLTVRNTGTVPSSGTITVTDTLPTGMTYVPAGSGGVGWTCNASGQVVTCTSTTVINGLSSGNPITLNVNVGASTPQPNVTNTATVSGGGEPTSNNGNNSGSDTSPVCPSACVDLVPVKTVGASPIAVGATASYSITVQNRGAQATNGTTAYTISDTLPSGMTLVAAPTAGTGWTCAANAPTTNVAGGTIVSCSRTTAIAANGTSTAVTFNVNVTGPAYPSVTNSVTVAGGGDTVSSNNTFSLTTPVTSFDLAISKAAGGGFTLNQTASYLLTVSNIGASATSGTVTVTDATLPANLTLNGNATATALNGSAALTWTCNGTAGATTLTCTTPGPLAAGSAYRITVPIAAIGTAVTNSPTLNNTATIAATAGLEPTSLLANNTSSTSDTADLSIAKAHFDPLPLNGTANYTLTVSNAGTVAIGGTTTVDDTFPAGSGLTLSAVPSGTGWTCTANSPTAGANTIGGTRVNCTSTTVVNPAGSLPQITVPVNVGTPSSQPFVNQATVSNTNEPVANRGNNTASDSTTVVQPPTWSKSFNPSTITVGATSLLTFTINRPTGALGVATMNGVSFVDPMPAALVVLSSPAPTNTCGGTVSAIPGDNMVALTGGSFSTTTCTVTVPVTAYSASAGLTNTTGPLITSNAGNAVAQSATLVVNAPAAATLTKQTSPNPVPLGATSTLTFTITNKATATNDIGFVDKLPTGMTATSANPTFGGTCTSTTGTALTRTYTAPAPPGTPQAQITIAGVDLAGGASCTITIPVTAASPGSYANVYNATASLSNVSGATPAGFDITKVNDTFVVLQAALSKAFSPTAVQPSAASTLTFTITNAAGLPAFANMNFTESLPTNVTLASAPAASQCNGTVAGTSGGTTITVTNAALVANQPSCTITAQVTSATTGLYLNDSARITAISTNLKNNVNASLAVFNTPTLSKTVTILNDPFNGTTSPKAIPGAEMEYTITINNASGAPLYVDSVVITDTVPTNTSLYVSGPLGPVTSFSVPGLTLSASDITYSNTAISPYSYTYTPVPVSGYDALVTSFRLNPKGTMSANSVGTLKFKVKVR